MNTFQCDGAPIARERRGVEQRHGSVDRGVHLVRMQVQRPTAPSGPVVAEGLVRGDLEGRGSDVERAAIRLGLVVLVERVAGVCEVECVIVEYTWSARRTLHTGCQHIHKINPMGAMVTHLPI